MHEDKLGLGSDLKLDPDPVHSDSKSFPALDLQLATDSVHSDLESLPSSDLRLELVSLLDQPSIGVEQEPQNCK